MEGGGKKEMEVMEEGTCGEEHWVLYGKQFDNKLLIELPYDPAIALLGIYPSDTEVLMHRSTCTPMFIAAL